MTSTEFLIQFNDWINGVSDEELLNMLKLMGHEIISEQENSIDK